MSRTGDMSGSCLTIRFETPIPADRAFDRLADQLADGLRRTDLTLKTQAEGTLREGEHRWGRVARWKRGREIALELKPAVWKKSPKARVTIRLEATPTGSSVTLAVEGWSELLEDPTDAMLDWAGGTLFPSLLHLFGPTALGDWLTDRQARRPTGEAAAATYRDPKYHWPNFLLILDRIRLRPSDCLLEVACGGGAFLHKALESGCAATAVDHSPDMLRVAREANRAAIEAGRLEILEGEADALPVPSNRFTCCVCTGAFDFFPNPEGALREMYRALAPNGRVAIFASSPALRGTIAAPEPIASRLSYHEAGELADMARGAGFRNVRTQDPDLGPYAKEAGLPRDVVEFFTGFGGSVLLLARKPGRTSRTVTRARAPKRRPHARRE
jgi:SAM-dependent methyltransferase